jgi:hypothetical protein
MNTSIGAMNTDIAGVNADAVAAAAAAAEAVPAAASATASAATAAADAVIAGDAAGEIQALYLGSKAANPTTDNQGNALVVGAMYFNTVVNLMKIYLGNSTWADAGSAVNGTLNRQNYVATAGQTVFAINYDVGFVDVYLNGVKLVVTTDFTALTGSDITLLTGATVGDAVELIAYGAFSVADQLQISNNLSDVASAPASIVNLGITATAAELNYASGVTSNIQTQIDAKAPVASPTFTGTATATAFAGDGSALTGIEALPSQTGNADKFLTTDGTNASWADAGGAWTLITTLNPSAASTIDFEGFTSDYDIYKLIFSLEFGSYDKLACRVKSNGSYQTTLYEYNIATQNTASPTIAVSQSTSDSRMFLTTGTTNNTMRLRGQITLLCPNDIDYQIITAETTRDSFGGEFRIENMVGAYRGLIKVMQGFRIMQEGSQTLTGVVQVYGLNK